MMNLTACSNCGCSIPDNDDFCSMCGTHRPVLEDNYCLNKQCDRFKIPIKRDLVYCGKCGKPTVLGIKIEELS